MHPNATTYTTTHTRTQAHANTYVQLHGHTDKHRVQTYMHTQRMQIRVSDNNSFDIPDICFYKGLGCKLLLKQPIINISSLDSIVMLHAEICTTYLRVVFVESIAVRENQSRVLHEFFTRLIPTNIKLRVKVMTCKATSRKAKSESP